MVSSRNGSVDGVKVRKSAGIRENLYSAEFFHPRWRGCPRVLVSQQHRSYSVTRRPHDFLHVVVRTREEPYKRGLWRKRLERWISRRLHRVGHAKRGATVSGQSPRYTDATRSFYNLRAAFLRVLHFHVSPVYQTVMQSVCREIDHTNARLPAIYPIPRSVGRAPCHSIQ